MSYQKLIANKINRNISIYIFIYSFFLDTITNRLLYDFAEHDGTKGLANTKYRP